MEPPGSDERWARARTGDASALSELLAEHAPRLERMVSLRMDRGALGALEPADVVQEALLDATRRFGEWCAQDRYPFRVWLRLLTAQALVNAERHMHREKRDVAREHALDANRHHVTARAAAEWLLSSHTTPTQAARRSELRDRVTAALEELDDIDREIIALRQFEQLSNAEAAAELGIDPAAATKRFARALQRMRPALREFERDVEGGR